jgi:hypothetical protein
LDLVRYATYSCRIEQRPEWRGGKLKESCRRLDGMELINLEVLWQMDEDEKYPREFALGGADEKQTASTERH